MLIEFLFNSLILEQETGVIVVGDAEREQQFRRFIEETVLGTSEFMLFGDVFSGEYFGVSGGKEGSGFVVSLIGAFPRGSGFPDRDSKRTIAGF